MKKLTLLAVLLPGSSIAATVQHAFTEGYTQDMEKYPPRPGIKAGAGIANLAIGSAGTINDKRAVPSWHAAIDGDMPLLPLFSVQPCLQLVKKGSSFTVGEKNGGNTVLRVPLARSMALLAGAGHYLSFGIAANNKLEGNAPGQSFDSDSGIEHNSNNNSSGFNIDLKRSDARLNFLAGVAAGGFTVTADYAYGPTNAQSGSSNNDSRYANRVMSLSPGPLL